MNNAIAVVGFAISFWAVATFGQYAVPALYTVASGQVPMEAAR